MSFHLARFVSPGRLLYDFPMTIHLGLFDIHQVDPISTADTQTVLNNRLDDLTYADELGGFEVAFTAERHYLQTHRCQSANVWLAAASQRTRDLRLGALAYTLPIHQPLPLAEEIAMLDHLTGGRIEVGVGLGHRTEELIANGIDPARRVQVFQERLAVLEGLLNGGQVTFESDHTVIRGAYLHPAAFQRPHPPLWFAGTDRPSAIWAGQHGMNLAVGFAPTEALMGATNGFREGVVMRVARSPAPDGLRRGEIALMRHVYVAEDDARARAEMVDDLLRLQSLNADCGEGSRGDRHAAAEAELDRLLESEIFLAGGPETVAKGIIRTRAMLGISIFLANVYAASVDVQRVRRTMQLLAGPVRETLTGAAATAGM